MWAAISLFFGKNRTWIEIGVIIVILLTGWYQWTKFTNGLVQRGRDETTAAVAAVAQAWANEVKVKDAIAVAANDEINKQHQEKVDEIFNEYNTVVRDRWRDVQLCNNQISKLQASVLSANPGTGSSVDAAGAVNGNQPASAGSVIGEAFRNCEVDAAHLTACQAYARLAQSTCGVK
jgi:hypothetical protein